MRYDTINRVIVIGSLNRDYSEDSGEQSTTHTLNNSAFAGGKALNHTIQLAKLGIDTAIFGCVGADKNGSFIKDFIEDINNQLSAHPIRDLICTSETDMTGVTFFIPEPSVRYFHVSGANDLPISDWIRSHRHAWDSSPCCLADLETNLKNVISAFDLANDRGAITVLDASHPARSVDELLMKTDIIIVRRRDVKMLLANAEYKEVVDDLLNDSGDKYDTFLSFASLLMKRGPCCVVFGLESSGCTWAYRDSDRIVVGNAPGPGTKLPYQNSAHAAFAGALVSQIVGHKSESTLRTKHQFLANLPWGSICRFASAAYVAAATKVGAAESMASAKEIGQVMNSMHFATRTVVSIDAVGSTAIHADTSLEAAFHFRKRMSDQLESLIRTYNPSFISWTGDGFWLVFDSALIAVQCAFAVADRIRDVNKLSNARKSGNLLPECRIGVNTGDVTVDSDGSVDGVMASMAKRVESWAIPGEVTITSHTKAMLSEGNFVFEQRIPQGLTKAGEPTLEIYSVTLKSNNISLN